MNLHTVMVTHNRLELTQEALASFFVTVAVPFSLVVVDNASTDGTQEWLEEAADCYSMDVLLLEENHYPGYACNRGWELAPKDATHLMRLDNDMKCLTGWCDEVTRMFRRKRRLGQLGLRTASEERNCSTNTGGNCIIRRDLFDRGLRWDERPWSAYPAGLSEDTYFSPAVRKMGAIWMRVTTPCLEMMSPDFSEVESWADDPYYVKSFGDRRIKHGSFRTRRRRRAS